MTQDYDNDSIAHTIGVIGHRLKTSKFERAAFLAGSPLRDSVMASAGALAAELPGAKRLSYDHSLLELTRRTRALALEEIIGQVGVTKLPFDKLWIEGPPPVVVAQDFPLRIGALVTRQPKDEGFAFTLAFTAHKTDRVTSFDVMTRVGKNGITFDEDKLLQVISLPQPNRQSDPSRIIDLYYLTADFLARSFVALASQKIMQQGYGAVSPQIEAEDKKIYAQNQLRARMKRPPRYPLRPIIIDLTALDARLRSDSDAKVVRQLLGWTAVRRSKPIISKHGTVFTRQPHDRRIPAPEDRRDAARVLRSGNNDVTIAVEAGRPVQVAGVSGEALGK